MVEDSGTQRADTDPRAGSWFKVLGKAAVKNEARIDIGGINRAHRGPELVEALFVERRMRALRLALIAWRDIRTTDPRVRFASRGTSLSSTPGMGIPMWPALSASHVAAIARGAVSVAPRPVTITTPSEIR